MGYFVVLAELLGFSEKRRPWLFGYQAIGSREDSQLELAFTGHQ